MFSEIGRSDRGRKRHAPKTDWAGDQGQVIVAAGQQSARLYLRVRKHRCNVVDRRGRNAMCVENGQPG